MPDVMQPDQSLLMRKWKLDGLSDDEIQARLRRAGAAGAGTPAPMKAYGPGGQAMPITNLRFGPGAFDTPPAPGPALRSYDDVIRERSSPDFNQPLPEPEMEKRMAPSPASQLGPAYRSVKKLTLTGASLGIPGGQEHGPEEDATKLENLPIANLRFGQAGVLDPEGRASPAKPPPPAEDTKGLEMGADEFSPGGTKQLAGVTPADQAFSEEGDKEKRMRRLSALKGIAEGLSRAGRGVVTGAMLSAGFGPEEGRTAEDIRKAIGDEEDKLSPGESAFIKQRFGIDIGPDAKRSQVMRLIPATAALLKSETLSQGRNALAADKAKAQALKDSRLPPKTMESIDANKKVLAELDRLEEAYKAISTGPIAGRMAQLERKLGISTPEQAAALSNEIYHAVDLLKSKGGARAVATQGVYEKLKKMTPEVILTSDAGHAIVNELRKHMRDEIAIDLSSAGSQGYNVQPHLLPGMKASKNEESGQWTVTAGSPDGKIRVRAPDGTVGSAPDREWLKNHTDYVEVPNG